MPPKLRDSGIGGDDLPIIQEQDEDDDGDQIMIDPANLGAAGGAAGGGAAGLPLPPVIPQQIPVAAISASAFSSKVQVPPYSGYPVGQTFQGHQGQQTELYEVRDWCVRVQTIGKAASWDDTVLGGHAAFALIPQTPAYNWYRNHVEDQTIQQWPAFMSAIIKEFSAPVGAVEKVNILNSFKQQRNEQIGDYVNRIRLRYKTFRLGLEGTFTEAKWAAESAGQKATRAEVIQKCVDYHLGSFFLVGLREEILVDVTRQDCATLDEMIASAKRSEQFIQGCGARSSAILHVAEVAPPSKPCPFSGSGYGQRLHRRLYGRDLKGHRWKR